MRIANLSDRAVLVAADHRAVDVHTASNGRFGPALADVYATWTEFLDWARTVDPSTGESFDPADLGAPAPSPRQLFAIGLNYSEHAAESGFAVPDTLPPIFTKFASCLSGPRTTVTLPRGGHTDWEVELVVVIGAEASKVSAEDAWGVVAGLTVGQDISERITQKAGPAPQFSMGKSFPGFGPMGPWLVTVDEFANPDDLELGCSINGEEMQKGRTADLIFPVPALIEKLSAQLTLHPGDVIFTGTPAGVGIGRSPERYLAPGDELVTYVEGIGELRQTFVAEG
ncbi:fumarylacetoacetate hydrolase family protein [Nocardioides albidus]|uniref:Fumarylacetoacetate hydrolase family protein n=1 Tax=Nocardioides albidus TaxID=1517589 RepID=A0A5C4VRM2_9ACTN|nr:fumarylacetoacetate hydrolase family protein [Nocardioides albidus]TNM38523.1 fumarylacetoacetate hydrolase family protein [Nocardioides albidus]